MVLSGMMTQQQPAPEGVRGPVSKKALRVSLPEHGGIAGDSVAQVSRDLEYHRPASLEVERRADGFLVYFCPMVRGWRQASEFAATSLDSGLSVVPHSPALRERGEEEYVVRLLPDRTGTILESRMGSLVETLAVAADSLPEDVRVVYRLGVTRHGRRAGTPGSVVFSPLSQAPVGLIPLVG